MITAVRRGRSAPFLLGGGVLRERGWGAEVETVETGRRLPGSHGQGGSTCSFSIWSYRIPMGCGFWVRTRRPRRWHPGCDGQREGTDGVGGQGPAGGGGRLCGQGRAAIPADRGDRRTGAQSCRGTTSDGGSANRMRSGVAGGGLRVRAGGHRRLYRERSPAFRSDHDRHREGVGRPFGARTGARRRHPRGAAQRAGGQLCLWCASCGPRCRTCR